MGRGGARVLSDSKSGIILEAAREEETLRYGASLLAESTHNDSEIPLDSSQISGASADPGLAAYAQLAALRLDAHTCMVSLFDGRRQHIVAEAKQSTAIELGRFSNLDIDPAQCPNPLLLSGTSVPRDHLACQHVLDLPTVESEEGKALTVVVIPDLAQDDRFSSLPYFGPNSFLGRSYAGVPLRSPHGIDIGVCSIFYNKPIEDLDAPSQRFLRHLSALIMSHLQGMVSAASYRRNERMVRGLGSMMDGLGSMSTSRYSPNPKFFEDAKGRQGVLKEGALNGRQQRIQAGASPDLSASARPIANAVQSTCSLQENGGEDTPFDSTETLDSDEKPDHARHNTTSSKTNDDENSLPLKSVFSRAANIIRESVEVEGVLFLDASIASYGRLVPEDPDVSHRSRSGSRSASRSGSSGDESMASDESTSRSRICRVLGFSDSDFSSINDDLPSEKHLSIPENFFDRVSRRYKDGQILNFDDDGELVWAVSDSDAGGSDNTTSPSSAGENMEKALRKRLRQRPRKSDGNYLTNIFPGARSVGIIPLWDSHKSRWFAGGFVWTRSRARVLNPGELSYLKAFGSCIMAEVARMEVLRESKAKEDVLGSLSHEIRSPLHGVILGVELMHDSVLTGFQNDVLHTVETCGRTLLDTLDHLLDFSKVNHFLQKPRRRIAGARSRGLGADAHTPAIEAGMMSVFSDLRLDLLIEEVIESVYAGFSFQDTSSQWGNRERANPSRFERASTLRRLESVRRMDSVQDYASGSESNTSVSVHLDIDPDVSSWGFYAQSGALRRIIMNVFGNALKYTSRGHIIVSLTQERFSTKKKSLRRNVILSISDSGRGISGDYLQNRLFTPFAQENQLSSGVGLGLSLVKQIVHGLGGRIGVESIVDRGSTIRVVIPLRLSSPQTSPTSATQQVDNEWLRLLDRLKGISVSLLGFSEAFGEDTKPLVVETGDTHRSPSDIMESLCRRFLHLTIIPEADAAANPPSMFICTEHAMHLIPVCEGGSIPTVVVCDTVLTSHQNETFFPPQSHSANREFISQPVGPRKLARVLVFALEKLEGAQSQVQDVQAGPAETLSGAQEAATPDMTKVSFGTVTSSENHKATANASVVLRGASEPSLAARRNGSSPVEPTTSASVVAPASGTRLQQPMTETTAEEPIYFLLVDDNAINLKILASYMRKLRRGFDCASNGLEALLACRARKVNYRCIFMDISMPVMDGLEATRLIRAHERQNDLEPALIIALTGLAAAKTQQEAYGSGVNLFLTKPVPMKELSLIISDKGL